MDRMLIGAVANPGTPETIRAALLQYAKKQAENDRILLDELEKAFPSGKPPDDPAKTGHYDDMGDD